MAQITTFTTSFNQNMRKKKSGHEKATPIPGALQKKYQSYVFTKNIMSRGKKPIKGKDFLSKEQLMERIKQNSSSAFGHINKARNKIYLNAAFTLAAELGCNVEDLVILDDDMQDLVNERRRKAFEEKLAREQEEWREKMGQWSLPLSKKRNEDLAFALAQKPRLTIVYPEADEVGLEVVPLLKELESQLAHAGETYARGGSCMFEAAAILADYAKQLSGVGLNLIWGKYVERIEDEEGEIDPYGDVYVELRKVLLVKVSPQQEELDFTVDRSHEARTLSQVENHAERDDDWGRSDYEAWCDGRNFWDEIR